MATGPPDGPCKANRIAVSFRLIPAQKASFSTSADNTISHQRDPTSGLRMFTAAQEETCLTLKLT